MDVHQNIIYKIRNTILKYLVMLYPIWISVTRFIPYFGTLLTASMIFVLVFDRIDKKKSFLKYIFVVTPLLLISTAMYPIHTRHEEHIKMILIFLLAMDSCYGKFYEDFIMLVKSYQRLLKIELFIVAAGNLFMMLVSAGYSMNFSGSWGIKAFQGLYGDPHQAAYHICALLICAIWISRVAYTPSMVFLIAGYEVCILMTGARVPTMLGLFIGLIFIMDILGAGSGADVRQKVISYIPIILIGLVVTYFITFHTSFGQKIISSLSHTQFDNGRGNLRAIDKEFFRNADFVHKLLGWGTDRTLLNHRDNLWSHNDYYQILCGMGLLMFFIYCLVWIRNVLLYIKQRNFWGIMAVICCVGIGFYNGLYIHSRLTFVLPLLLIYMYKRKEIATNTKMDF